MSVRATESNTTRVSLVILAVIATGAALYWLRGSLTPLALAVFLAVMVDGFARVIRMRLPWVSERAALPLAIVLSVLLFGISTFVIAENATTFVGQLVAYTPRLNGLIARATARRASGSRFAGWRRSALGSPMMVRKPAASWRMPNSRGL